MHTLSQFKDQRILLLQGPLGPFFARLARDLKTVGANVFKINFNAGDQFYYWQNAQSYRGSLQDWPSFLKKYIETNKISMILLFGDCRPLHREAVDLAKALGLRLGVFEEGYLRPNYVTLDWGGANDYSLLSRNREDYLGEPYVDPAKVAQREKIVEAPIYMMGWWTFFYHFMRVIFCFLYPRNRHHRPGNLSEFLCQLYGRARRYYRAYLERGILENLLSVHEKQFFLVPLQLYNDAQLTEHSDYKNIEHFIEDIVTSFALNAPKNCLLVIKHHPMDRISKAETIKRCSQKMGIESRCYYIHDQHLPSLLQAARGVVLINSTVGLSALYHQCSLKVMGRALYDIQGLTFGGSLEEFWNQAQDFEPDMDLYAKYRNVLLNKTQINGNFYKRLSSSRFASGLLWGDA